MKGALSIALGLLFVLGGAGCSLYSEIREFPDAKAEIKGGEVIFEIPRGKSPQAISELLADQGVVENPRYFYYYLRYLAKYEGKTDLKAGEYQFKSGMTMRDVAAKLHRGDIYKHRVTVPEGLTYEEIIEIFSGKGLGDREALLKLCTDKTFVRGLGIPADSIEGYLYPDTYTFPRGLSAEQTIRMMHRRFQEVFGQVALKAQARGLSMHEAVTLASIVEKETGAPQERPIIAAVFYNRMKKKMRLQTDPTVIYGVLRSKGTFNGNITKRDLETPTAYNTYTIPGLPPGPIASPGGEALRAVGDPAVSDAIFFVSKNDGTHVFCADYACHLKNVNKWQVEFFRKKR